MRTTNHRQLASLFTRAFNLRCVLPFGVISSRNFSSNNNNNNNSKFKLKGLPFSLPPQQAIDAYETHKKENGIGFLVNDKKTTLECAYMPYVGERAEATSGGNTCKALALLVFYPVVARRENENDIA